MDMGMFIPDYLLILLPLKYLKTIFRHLLNGQYSILIQCIFVYYFLCAALLLNVISKADSKLIYNLLQNVSST